MERDVQAPDDPTRRALYPRATIDDYLSRHRRQQVDDGFGLWGKNRIDGLAYQETLRREW